MITTSRPTAHRGIDAWEEVSCGECGKRNIDLDRARGLVRFKCSARDCKVVHVVFIGPLAEHATTC